MSKFFDPTADDTDKDEARLYASATERNRDALAAVMQAHLTEKGTLIEVASGTGQHAAYIAPYLPHIIWQPTDIEPRHLKSIDAWRTHTNNKNVLSAQYFNVLDNDFGTLAGGVHICAVAAINLIHIAPWSVAEALIQKAGAYLQKGTLFLYGPYRRGGKHTAQSNADFDISLKSRDPAWGIRDIEAVTLCAEKSGFRAPTIIDMPANNLSVIFKKTV